MSQCKQQGSSAVVSAPHYNIAIRILSKDIFETVNMVKRANRTVRKITDFTPLDFLFTRLSKKGCV
jgi:hypothetical protein